MPNFYQQGSLPIAEIKKEFVEEEPKIDFKQLRETMNFGDSSMSSFNQEGAPPIVKVKKEFMEEEQESDFKQLSKTMNFKGSPMSSFYKEGPPPIVKVKKEFVEEEHEANFKQLRKSMNFVSSPMSSLYQEAPPHIIVKVKKEFVEEQGEDFEQLGKMMNFEATPMPSIYLEDPPPVLKVKKEFAEEQGADSEQLGKTMTFEATPMPNIYLEDPPPVFKVKKVPSRSARRKKAKRIWHRTCRLNKKNKEFAEEQGADSDQLGKTMTFEATPIPSIYLEDPPAVFKVPSRSARRNKAKRIRRRTFRLNKENKEFVEEQEANFEQLGKMNFRATPMRSFYLEGPPLVLNVKKVASTSARQKKASRIWNWTFSSNNEKKKEEEAALKQLAVNINLRTTPMSIFYQEGPHPIAEEGISSRSNLALSSSNGVAGK